MIDRLDSSEYSPNSMMRAGWFWLFRKCLRKSFKAGKNSGFTHQPGMFGHSREERSAHLVPSVWPGIGCLFYHRTLG